jgi:glycosyltransferase involved in cell wall biosynthesis
MPIALVTNYLPPYRLPLYRLLHERYGVEVHCFGGEPHYVPESLRDLDRQIEQAPFPAHRLARQSDAEALARSNDAVISVIAGRVALPAAYRGARRAKTPFVLWASLWRHPLTIPHTFSLRLMRRIYRRADAIVTYGSHVSRYVSRYRRSTEGVFVAPQAVEPEIFGREIPLDEQREWRRQAGLPPDLPIILFVGRLERDKGVDVLLRAWGRLGREDAVLCFVGDGPRAGAVRSAGAGVVFAGALERTRLPVAYAAAHTVVVPSIATRRFLEPWGLVCNEAMLQGTPVIASSAVGAVPGALVIHGASGLIVRPRDDRELASAIALVLDDERLHERLGRIGEAAVEPFNYDAAADAFGEALAVAMAGGRAGR